MQRCHCMLRPPRRAILLAPCLFSASLNCIYFPRSTPGGRYEVDLQFAKNPAASQPAPEFVIVELRGRLYTSDLKNSGDSKVFQIDRANSRTSNDPHIAFDVPPLEGYPQLILPGPCTVVIMSIRKRSRVLVFALGHRIVTIATGESHIASGLVSDV